MRLLLIIPLALLTAVSCGHNRQSAENNASENQDSSKIRTLEAFLNIDYTKAFEDISSSDHSIPDFSEVLAQDPESTTPMLIFISRPDCSACIASTLDFFLTYIRTDTDCPAPLIVFKSGDTDIFEFYRDKLAADQDSTIKSTLERARYINGDWPSVNSAPDGAYLLYRNRTIGHLPWSLL